MSFPNPLLQHTQKEREKQVPAISWQGGVGPWLVILSAGLVVGRGPQAQGRKKKKNPAAAFSSSFRDEVKEKLKQYSLGLVLSFRNNFLKHEYTTLAFPQT